MSPVMLKAQVSRTLLYSWLSYQALFSWSRPRIYVASLIILPASIGTLFVIVNNAVHADASRPVLGSALLATNNAVMYGMALVIMNERWYGSLELWLAVPQTLLRSLLTKSIVHLGNGLVTGTVTFVSVSLMFGVHLPPGAVWRLYLCALAVSVSAAGIGMVTASLGILGRDALAAPNAMRSLILLSSSAVVDAGVLGTQVDTIGHVLPVRHAIEAATAVLRGEGLDFTQLAWEALVGGGWGLVGFVALRHVLVFSRRRGRLHLR